MAELSRGANAPLAGGRLELAVAGARQGAVDLLAFQLGSDRRVRSDADMVFFNQPASPEGAVRLTAPDRMTVDTGAVPPDVETLAVAVSLDDAVPGSLAGVAGLGVTVSGADGHRAPAVGLTTERAAVLVEIYRRAGAWKIRNVSAGWAAGLAALAREHGVEVDEPAPAASTPARTAPAVRDELPPPVLPAPAGYAGGTAAAAYPGVAPSAGYPGGTAPAGYPGGTAPAGYPGAPAPAGYPGAAPQGRPAAGRPPAAPPPATPGGFPPPGGSLPPAVPPVPTGALPAPGGFPPPGGDLPPPVAGPVPRDVGGWPPP
ncbi:TerD family protein [Nakamurella endophytica]|uniref:TerD domain-containing protein n=1 Tax=Nakamurella endophytica TaxID=1748367 RepID=A0A917WDR8_9ACTN|nr:TerD family protein [Nakamurella endophytica]GGL96038.1 hypothetical protein GCM10011594_14680 [Nakamurella endophytica]